MQNLKTNNSDSNNQKGVWKEYRLDNCVDILDNQRVPINSDTRANRQGNVPYYGATGRVGWIDNHIFDEELILLGEDGAPFFDKSKPISYIITGKSWVNNHAHVLRAKKDIADNWFIKYYLDYFDFTDYVGGTTRLKLTQTAMKDIPIFLPNIDEQIKIASNIKEATSLKDSSLLKIAKAKRLVTSFRKAILTAATTGKLTDEWQVKNFKTTKAEINYVQKNKKTKVQYDISHFRMFDLPDGWEWRQFWEIAEIKSNLVAPTDYQNYILVAPDNIEKETGKLLEKKLVKEIKPISAKHLFFNGQIVYSKIRPYLSKLIYADFDGLCSADMYPISPRINVRYLMIFMLSQFFLDTVSNIGTRTLLPKTNQEELNSIPVPVPPLEEQEEIVKKVDALLELAKRTEDHINVAHHKANKINQAILSKVFT